MQTVKDVYGLQDSVQGANR